MRRITAKDREGKAAPIKCQGRGLAKEVGAIVAAAAAWARTRGVETQPEAIRGYPGEHLGTALVKFSEENGVHTIFVRPVGRTGIMRVLLGSTA